MNYLDRIKNIFLESNKTKIAILGKGSSIDSVKLDFLQDYFIIGLNDVEKIVPNVDLSIFYKEGVFHSIKDNNFKSANYIAPSKFEIPSSRHISADYLSLDQEGIERIYTYFSLNKFFILDFTLLSAVKLSLMFQKIKNILIDVVFIGFDFYVESVKEGDFLGIEYRNAHLKTQESLFVTILQHIKEQFPLVNFRHIGNKKYSSLSIEDFNQSLFEYDTDPSALKTNSELYKELIESLYDTNKVIIVAELTNNHIGDKNRLLKMIELASESGADMIKVQKRNVDTFYTEDELKAPYSSPFGSTLEDYRKAVELSDELFDILDLECRKRNIPWFVSVLDWDSYQYILQKDCPIIKLPSTISNHKGYLTKVATDFKGDLVVSTGFTDVEYEDFILTKLVKDNNFFLLQCTSSYPTPPEGCHLNVIKHYDSLRKDYPNIIPGYSSHDLGSLACMMAVASGAKMIEKHVKLGDLDWVHFDSVAIDLYNDNFKSFVNDIRKAEIMCGESNKNILSFEHHKYKPNKKSY